MRFFRSLGSLLGGFGRVIIAFPVVLFLVPAPLQANVFVGYMIFEMCLYVIKF